MALLKRSIINKEMFGFERLLPIFTQAEKPDRYLMKF